MDQNPKSRFKFQFLRWMFATNASLYYSFSSRTLREGFMANQSDMPEEIQEEYYDAKPKERAGVAWLLAFGTLIITIVIAAGVFFAGRWTYRQIAGDPETTETTSSENESEAEQQPDDQTAPTDPSAEPETDDETAPAEENGVVAGDATEDLPSTGPEHTLAAFLAISLLGYIVHRSITRRSKA